MSLVSKIFTINKTANKYLSVNPKKMFYAASNQGAMRYPFVAFEKNHTVIGKKIFCKKKHHIDVVHVPGFHLFARSSSFFRAFLLHFYGKPFYGSLYLVYVLKPLVIS